MSGYSYGDREPKVKCPYCKSSCHADFVDVGIGYTQCGPHYCHSCKASEIGPYDTPRQLTAVEEKTGWYAPGEPVGDSANTVGGRPVDHLEASLAYEAVILDKKPGK